MKYQRPPGTHDVYPGAPKFEDSSAHWRRLENTFRDVCRLFSYEEIRTPIIEPTELFTRAVGQGTDIVSKEMYTFEDRGGRSLTLRPEGTAGVLRAYLQNSLYAAGGVSKLYYIGPNFRYERQQKGRYRQHFQCGLEAIGSQDPRLDAEIVQLALTVLTKLGISRLDLYINSVGCPICRPLYRAALVAFATPFATEMSEDNQRRLAENPLRMLDSKDDNDQALLASAPILTDYLCAECGSHFESLQSLLRLVGVGFKINPRLVRGFDYYTKTAFEITSPDLGAQATLCGGGRYDGLVEELGGSPAPGIGFGMGIERVLIALQALGAEPEPTREPWAFLVAMGDNASREAVAILSGLRAAGLRADMDFAGKSFKSQMRAADRSGARFALILGDDELAAGTISVKDMESASQEIVPIADCARRLSARMTNSAS
jgi:histidyl-tRNA synthetase